MNEHDLHLTVTLYEACDALDLEYHYLVEIVETGIVEPLESGGEAPENWRFDANMLHRMQRALRLGRDLELDWSATAIVLDLLSEKEYLQRENERLRQQLQRFLED